MADKGKKRKAARRSAAPQGQSSGYNAEMFRSLGCEKFYGSINANSKFIRERELSLAPGDFEAIRANIINRGWERYVAYPKVASKALVFEFFSNVLPKVKVDGPLEFPQSISYVRGRNVPFDAATINRLFGLAPVPMLDCLLKTEMSRKNVQDDPERDGEIRNLLCKPGMDWVRNSRGDPQKILTGSLNPVAKGWAGFILATICPSSNSSELGLDRAILASCIIRGDPVNLGCVLERELNEFAEFKKGAQVRPPNYWKYASLVALLCAEVGVVANPDEATIPPAGAIDGKWIRTTAKEEHPVQREEQPQQEQPDEHEPAFNIDDLVGPSAEDFQSLKERVDMVVANQEDMKAELLVIRRNQERIIGENRFGMRALYRAIAAQSGGQLDPQADIFQPLRPP